MPSGPPRCRDHAGIHPLLTWLDRKDDPFLLVLLGQLAMRASSIAAHPASRKRQATECTEPADARRNRRIERCTARNRSAVSDSSVLSVHSVVLCQTLMTTHRRTRFGLTAIGAVGSSGFGVGVRFMRAFS